ncbi:MAG: NYN domain-containing protein [Geminicoccaceae bacterium]
MTSEPTRRLAVLIDADNTSPRIAEALFAEVAKIGEASVRRIYGDFSGTRLKAWADILSRHAIIRTSSSPTRRARTPRDIALVIDAMDLLLSGRFDGFCLVSSDSDFTRLAARIREQGTDVFGFGEKKTPESFRQACRRFIYTENLLAPAAADAPTDDAEATPTAEPPEEALAILERIIADLDQDDGWVFLSNVGSRLANLAPDFDPRTYGHKRLGDLVKATGAFEIATETGSGTRIRRKPAKQKGRSRKRKAAAEPA